MTGYLWKWIALVGIHHQHGLQGHAWGSYGGRPPLGPRSEKVAPLLSNSACPGQKPSKDSLSGQNFWALPLATPYTPFALKLWLCWAGKTSKDSLFAQDFGPSPWRRPKRAYDGLSTSVTCGWFQRLHY